MKSSKIFAVALVTAFLFTVFVILGSAASEPSYWDYYNQGMIYPSPDYPNREALPYGDDTAVYEFKQHYSSSETLVFRIYIRRDLYDGSAVSAFNGATVVFVDEGSGTYPDFEILHASPATIFTQTYRYNNSTGVVSNWSSVSTSPYTKESAGRIYQFGVKTGQISSSYSQGKWSGVVYATDPCYYGGRDLRSLVLSNALVNAPSDQLPAYSGVYHLTSKTLSYPTSNDISSKNIANSIDESNQKVVEQIKAESEKQITAINNAASKVEGAITQAVDDIINAGSDFPTLDTDKQWMNDSLTKVNDWLSQLEDFKKQMDEAEADNAQNMEQAKSFVDGFFSAVPGPIISALTLILVGLVAVKIVGR